MTVFFPIKTRRERANDVRKKLIIRHRIDREDGQEEHAAHQGLAREGPRDGQVQEVAQPHRPRHQVGGGVLDVLNRRDVSAVLDPVSAASVAMLPVIDATVGLSFGWFVAFGLIGAIRDVPGMTTRDVLLPAVCKKDGVDMQRFVGVSQSAESLLAAVGPSAVAERAVS